MKDWMFLAKLDEFLVVGELYAIVALPADVKLGTWRYGIYLGEVDPLLSEPGGFFTSEHRFLSDGVVWRPFVFDSIKRISQ